MNNQFSRNNFNSGERAAFTTINVVRFGWLVEALLQRLLLLKFVVANAARLYNLCLFKGFFVLFFVCENCINEPIEIGYLPLLSCLHRRLGR